MHIPLPLHYRDVIIKNLKLSVRMGSYENTKYPKIERPTKQLQHLFPKKILKH